MSSDGVAPAARKRDANRRARWDNSGINAIVTEVTVSAKARSRAINQVRTRRHDETDKGEFSACAEQQPHFDCDRPRQPEQPGQSDDQKRFDSDQSGDRASKQQRLA